MTSEERSEERTVQELNALIETHFDSMEVMKRAVEGIADSVIRAEIEEMVADHQEAVDYLTERIGQLGGTPAADEHSINVLRISWQELWKGGGDSEVLQALRANKRVAVDGLQLQMTKETLLQTMTDEGVREHLKTLKLELRHFQMISDRLRNLGIAVDNDEVMGAVRNAAEHVHAAINLSGEAVEAFFKWATGPRG